MVPQITAACQYPSPGALCRPGLSPAAWKQVQPDITEKQSRNILWTEGRRARLLFGGVGLLPTCCQGKPSPNLAETFTSPAEIVRKVKEFCTV